MRILPSLILAGAAVTGLAVLAPSLARELDNHTVTVRLPGGGVETIEYTGKIAPKVSFPAAPMMVSMADPFAAFDQISLAMDRQMDTMMHQAQMLAVMPQGQPLVRATLNGVPQGASFSMVSQTIGNGACVQTTQVTQGPGDAKPHVVSRTSGNCGADAHGEGAYTAVPAGNPDVRQINYHAPVAHPARSAL
jgi:hypothetical protein